MFLRRASSFGKGKVSGVLTMNTQLLPKALHYEGKFLFTSRLDLGNPLPDLGQILNDVGMLYGLPEKYKKHDRSHRLFIWFDPWINADFQIRSALSSDSSVYLLGCAKNNDR